MSSIQHPKRVLIDFSIWVNGNESRGVLGNIVIEQRHQKYHVLMQCGWV